MDVIAAFDKVKESYINYVKTAFGTQYPGLEAERERMLRQPGAICQEPWIEPLPRYQLSGKTIWDLAEPDAPGLDAPTITAFKELAACGLVGNFQLYRHQVEMLEKALTGTSSVVTAGTGSGKTESFLLPLIAYLVRESSAWSRPASRLPHQDDWWTDEDWRDECVPLRGRSRRIVKSLRVSQRSHETRDAAVRGLVLYPMNALVEDQLSRMRRSLDSPEARQWFDENRGGNKIYFGRYNGKHQCQAMNSGALLGQAHDGRIGQELKLLRRSLRKMKMRQEQLKSTHNRVATETFVTSFLDWMAPKCVPDGICRMPLPTF